MAAKQAKARRIAPGPPAVGSGFVRGARELTTKPPRSPAPNVPPPAGTATRRRLAVNALVPPGGKLRHLSKKGGAWYNDSATLIDYTPRRSAAVIFPHHCQRPPTTATSRSPEPPRLAPLLPPFPHHLSGHRSDTVNGRQPPPAPPPLPKALLAELGGYAGPAGLSATNGLTDAHTPQLFGGADLAA